MAVDMILKIVLGAGNIQEGRWMITKGGWMAVDMILVIVLGVGSIYEGR